MVLDENTADRAGYELGDQVAIVTATQTLDVHPTLVGIAGFREGGSLNGATYAAFDTPTAQQLFLDGQDAYNTFWITAKDGVSQEELTDQANAALPDGYEAITGDDAAEERAGPLLSGIDFLTTFLLIFAGIALVVSSYIIVNTFSILVAQRSRELALLRALGASKRQVIRSVQLEAFVVGVVGSTLGLGLGFVLAMGIRSLVATFGLDLADQPLILAPRTPVAAYATGIVVTMVAAWLPARRTGRIAPVQALRDDVALPESSVRRRLLLGIALIALGIPLAVIGLFVGAVPHNGWWVGAGVLAVLLGVTAASPVIGRPFLRATGAADAKLFGPIGQLAGQNSLRNPRRTTATASALMIGLTLAFTVAILGVLRQGVGGRAGGGQLHRRLHRQQCVRRGVLAGDHRPDGRHRRRGLGAPRAVRLRPPRRRPDVRRGHRAGDDLRLRHDHGLRPGHRPGRRHGPRGEGLGQREPRHHGRHLRDHGADRQAGSGGSSASSRRPR